MPETKKRLLEAAVKIFGAKGFLATTVREICQEAAVNIAAINYHFGDKEQLYATVLHFIFNFHKQIRDQKLVHIVNSDAHPEKRLKAYIYMIVHHTYGKDCSNCTSCPSKTNQNCAPYSIFLMEMAHPSEVLDDIVEQYIRPDVESLMDILRKYFDANVSQALLKLCADSIWGQILHPTMFWPIDQRLNQSTKFKSIDTQALKQHVYEFTLGGLRRIKQQLHTENKRGLV